MSTKQRSAIRRKLGSAIEGNVRLSQEQRHFVLDELRDDLQKLKEDYGVSISDWKLEA
ncbi:MAG: hypothetical protein AAF921_13900 [Cyanobacteria bacterium P01_D01_bin.44]